MNQPTDDHRVLIARDLLEGTDYRLALKVESHPVADVMTIMGGILMLIVLAGVFQAALQYQANRWAADVSHYPCRAIMPDDVKGDRI